MTGTPEEQIFLRKRKVYLSHPRLWEYLLAACSSAPAARSPFLIGFCSKFWTGRGTSSASSAVIANVLCQKSVFHEKGSCTVRMTSSGKQGVIYYLLIYQLYKSIYILHSFYPNHITGNFGVIYIYIRE